MHRSTMHLHQLHSSSCASSSTVGLCSAVTTRHGRAFTSVVVRAGANGAENGRLTSEKQREIAKILLQTQKNMLELNNSRVKVQEELAMAHRRIADLERELERLRVEQAREQLEKAEQAAAAALAVAAPVLEAPVQQAPAVVPPPQQQQAPAAAAPAAAQAPPAYPPQQQQQVPQQMQFQPPATNHHSPPPQQQQQQQMVVPQMVHPAAAAVAAAAPSPPPSPPPAAAAAAPAPPPQQVEPPPPAPPAVINLTYISGWHNCFVHFKVDDKPWTQAPGTRLTTDKRDHNMKHIRIEGKSMEFVMTNGENDWDSPGRYTDKPKNYTITAPGSYRLKSGKLELLPHTTAQ